MEPSTQQQQQQYAAEGDEVKSLVGNIFDDSEDISVVMEARAKAGYGAGSKMPDLARASLDRDLEIVWTWLQHITTLEQPVGREGGGISWNFTNEFDICKCV